MKFALAACLAALHVVGTQAPINMDNPVAVKEPVVGSGALVAGTPILLELLSTISTDGGSWKRGDRFGLVVSEAVIAGGQVVIPAGTLAFGRVRWATGRGAFGKSGKMEIEMDHLVLGGRQVKLTGTYRQDGQGAILSPTAAVAAGPFAAFITGESGKIMRGAIITAHLAENLPIVSTKEEPGRPEHGKARTILRSRQISVAEAFKTEIASAELSKSALNNRSRPSVAEAFRAEIASFATQP